MVVSKSIPVRVPIAKLKLLQDKALGHSNKLPIAIYSGLVSPIYRFFIVQASSSTYFPLTTLYLTHPPTHPSLPGHKHQPYEIIPSVLSLLLLNHFSVIHFSLADRRYSFRIVSSLPLVSAGLYGAL